MAEHFVGAIYVLLNGPALGGNSLTNTMSISEDTMSSFLRFILMVPQRYMPYLPHGDKYPGYFYVMMR